MIPSQPLTIRFGKLDQGTGSRHVRIGTLTEARNVRQREAGRLDKRYGYGATLGKTTDSGSITTAQGLGATADALVLHADDALFVRDGSTWRNRGTQPRCMPSDVQAIPQCGYWPTLAIANGYAFQFAVGTLGSTQGIYYRVTTLATGSEVKAPTFINASVRRMKAVAAGNNVWLFYASSESAVTLAKFDATSPTAAPTSTTYLNVTSHVAGDAFCWDVRVESSVVYFASLHNTTESITGGAGAHHLWLSILNQSTGLATAWVSADPFVAPGSTNLTGPLCWLGVASGLIYLAGNSTSGGAPGNFKLLSMSATDLSGLATVWSQTGLAPADRSLSGWVVSSSDISVLLSDISNGAGGLGSEAQTDACTITRYVWNGSAVSSAVWRRGHFVASDPFEMSGARYIVLGHDDLDNSQRAYDLYSITASKFVASHMYTRGALAFAKPRVTTSDVNNVQGHNTPISVSGSKAYCLLMQTNNLNNPGSAAGSFSTELESRLVTWDFGASYGPMVPFQSDRHVLFPGGWPSRLSVADAAIGELTPMCQPGTPALTASGGGTLAAANWAVRNTYAFIDPLGNVIRSAPSAAVTVATGANNQIANVVPTLRRTNASSNVYIETWMTIAGATGSFFLVKRTPNDSSVNTLSIAITAAPVTGAEILYTDGGETANFPAPVCRAGFVWKDRLWLFATDEDGVAWGSKEFIVGRLAEFYTPGKVTIYTGRGRIYAGAALSADYALILKADQLVAVTGVGPDDAGTGGYQLLTLPTAKGTTRPHSVCSYPGGVLYQADDGSICKVDTGMQVRELTDAEDVVTASTVVSVVHSPGERIVRFWLANGQIAVLDYGNATAESPDGVWYHDEGTGFSAAVAATSFQGTVYMVDSDGDVRAEVSEQYHDDNQPILRKVVLAPLQVADMGGETRISRGQLIGEYHSAHSLRITTTPDGGTSENHDKTVSAGPERFTFRPARCGRVGELQVSIEDTGSDTGRGSTWDGFHFEVQPRGRGKRVNAAQRI